MAGEAAYWRGTPSAGVTSSRSYVQPELRQALPKGQWKDWTERDRDTETQRESCPAGTPVSPEHRDREPTDCHRQREHCPRVGTIMEEERVPALSPGARMHPVHPDDVRIAEGRDRAAARGRRKVSPAPLSSTPLRRVPSAVLACHAVPLEAEECAQLTEPFIRGVLRTEASQQEAAGEEIRRAQCQGSTEERSFLGHEDRYAQLPRRSRRAAVTAPRHGAD